MKNFFFIFFSVFVFLGCQSKSIKTSTLSLEKDDPLIAKGAKPLTFIGFNHSPSLSRDQSRFLFVSEKRRAHQQPQIYEYDFFNFKEKRMSFQDSPNIQPSYMSDDTFLYSSATDEIKEDFLDQIDLNIKLTAFEIYQADTQSDDIIRWTQHPGYDGFAFPLRQGIIFLSKNGNRTLLAIKASSTAAVTFPLKSWNAEIQSLHKGKNQYYWVQKDSDGSQIYSWKENSKSPTLVMKTSGEFSSLSEAPNAQSLLVSYKTNSDKDQKIILYKTDEKCFVPLLQEKNQSFEDPLFLSSTPSRFLFTRKWQGQSQIYILDFLAQTIPCHPLGNEDTLVL